MTVGCEGDIVIEAKGKLQVTSIGVELKSDGDVKLEAGKFSVKGDVDIDGNLSVTKNTTISGEVEISKDVTISGNVEIK